MPPSLAFLTNRPARADAVTPRRMLRWRWSRRCTWRTSLMLWSESGLRAEVHSSALTGGVLNFFGSLVAPAVSRRARAMIVILDPGVALKYGLHLGETRPFPLI